MRFNVIFQRIVRFEVIEVSHPICLAIGIGFRLGKVSVPTEPELLEVLPVSLHDRCNPKSIHHRNEAEPFFPAPSVVPPHSA